MAKTPVKGWSANVQPSPWWTGWRLTVALLLIVVVGGTIGYVVIEDWPVWDALYMTVISVTTVGYREVHIQSAARRGDASGGSSGRPGPHGESARARSRRESYGSTEAMSRR